MESTEPVVVDVVTVENGTSTLMVTIPLVPVIVCVTKD